MQDGDAVLESPKKVDSEKSVEVRNGDAVRTSLSLQSDLEQLYTGASLPIHFAYVQLIAMLWCSLIFSTGLPIMYVIALIFYLISYAVYKCLVLKHYKCDLEIDDTIPQSATTLMKYAVMLHVFFAAFMLSTKKVFREQAR